MHIFQFSSRSRHVITAQGYRAELTPAEPLPPGRSISWIPKVIALGALVTFVGRGIPPAEAAAAENLPEGQASLNLPGQVLRPGIRFDWKIPGSPPPNADDELLASRRASYVPPQPYRQGWAAIRGYREEIDELLQERRSLFTPQRPYSAGSISTGHKTEEIAAAPQDLPEGQSSLSIPQRSWVQKPATSWTPHQPEDAAAQALPEGARAVVTPSERRELGRAIVVPPAPDEPIPDGFGTQVVPLGVIPSSPLLFWRSSCVDILAAAAALPEGKQAVYLPLQSYRSHVRTLSGFPGEPLPEARAVIYAPIARYRGQVSISFPPPVQPVIVEADELLTGRKASWIPPQPYRSAGWIRTMGPDALRELDEALASRRAIYAPVRPYESGLRSKTTGRTVEIDELLPGRRVVYLPIRPYGTHQWVSFPALFEAPPEGRQSYPIPSERRERGYALVVPSSLDEKLPEGRQRFPIPDERRVQGSALITFVEPVPPQALPEGRVLFVPELERRARGYGYTSWLEISSQSLLAARRPFIPPARTLFFVPPKRPVTFTAGARQFMFIAEVPEA